MNDITEKPRYRVTAGKALNQEQVTDLRGKTFYRHLIRTDTDEILKKAGISRHALKTLLTDPDIDQAIDRREEELGSATYTITPSEGAVADFIYEQLDLHLETILQGSSLSKWYGYDVIEMLWGKDSNGRNAVTSMMSKPIQWFEPLSGGALQWFPNDGSQPVMISDQADFYYRYLYQQHKPTYLNPKGKSLLSRVYWLHYFKTNGWRFWSKFLERFGSPLLIGKTDATSDADAQDFANALLAAHNSGVVTIGVDEDVTAVTGGSNGEAFVSYDSVVKQSITTYLLGQTLTSGTDKGGTYGQGVVHQEQQEIIFSSDRKHALKAVQRFIDVICTANGFEIPEFKWVAKKFINQDQLDADKKAHDMGVRFTKSYFVDEHGYNEQHIAYMDYGNGAVSLPTSTQANRYASMTSKTWLPFKAADSDSEFTDEQQELERVADDALELSLQPFDVNKVLSAIELATDADSLREALFSMVGDSLAQSEFTQLVNTAIQVADVHGFADESSEV
ncbi:phage portal protein family protein [Psychrobacter sp. 1Y1]|uniref:phage portal protein family protein n=1 Tax=Psychrobacter sp. 1Y1 TaxID=3453574 RepID=UPI003F44D63D